MNKSFCDKYPNEAFEMGAHNYISTCKMDNIPYDMYNYYLTETTIKKLNTISTYFGALDSYYIKLPICEKYRKTTLDLFDFMIYSFDAMQDLVSNQCTLALGSEYVCAVAWLRFNNKDKFAKRYVVGGIPELIKNYSDDCKGQCSATRISFYQHGRGKDVLDNLADKYKQSTNRFLSIIVAFYYDVIVNCGPDCKIVKGFFTNHATKSFFDADTIRIWKSAIDLSFSENKSQIKRTIVKTDENNYDDVIVDSDDSDDQLNYYLAAWSAFGHYQNKDGRRVYDVDIQKCATESLFVGINMKSILKKDKKPHEEDNSYNYCLNCGCD